MFDPSLKAAVCRLFVAAASPLHGGRTLRTVPLPLWSLRQTDAAVVEPLDRTLNTGNTNLSFQLWINQSDRFNEKGQKSLVVLSHTQQQTE